MIRRGDGNNSLDRGKGIDTITIHLIAYLANHAIYARMHVDLLLYNQHDIVTSCMQ